jgi:co-chaperonin GroES (HSP10)
MLSKKITPNGNNCIVRIVPNEEKMGRFVVADTAKEKSTLAEVMIPPRFSYHPNGDLKNSILRVGMKVRLPKGQCGTGMPESPEGEEWMSVAEDLIEYTIEEINHE